MKYAILMVNMLVWMNMKFPAGQLPARCLAVAFFISLASLTRAEILASGPIRLFVSENTAVKLRLTNLPTETFQAEHPVCLQLLTKSGTTLWFSNSYSQVTRSGDSLRCSGTILSPAGSVFRFADTFQTGPKPGTVELLREVRVQQAADDDAGFLTRFSLCATAPQPLAGYEVFIPGICYRDNHDVPAHALAADLAQENILCREDRMPLPLVMMRDKISGTTLTLVHSNPDGATCLADYSPARLVSSDVQVASLGIFGQANAAAALCFPASEGERSYLRRDGWAERFHPVRPGVKHAYDILFQLSQQPDFPRAMKSAWRLGFDQIHPPAVKVDVAACYDASIQLVSDWSRTTRGAPGLPFRLRLPQGDLEKEELVNYQMGFIGQQIPLAYHLLRHGLLHTNETMVRKGEATVDFWAKNSLTAEGLPRTWFDTWPQPHWRNYHTFLRVASDGMDGAVMAYDTMAAAGRPKPEWLTFCQRFGDWLLTHQNPDGSWYREYNFDSTPANKGKQNTSHPVRYLVDLSKLTGNRRYLDAALRAGNWCWTNTHQAFCYVGGTVDNPNVTDKEAGFIALDAFLALHDATGDVCWLKAATQAADFTETWAYCWNIPMPADDTESVYPRGATTTGYSLIACGHSGADLFLAGAAFNFYRLYLQTGDTHYAEMARQFLYDPRQSVDINGSRGYGHSGLCTEAISLAAPRGHGVNVWLPWLSYNMIDPLVRLQQTYGMMDTPILTDTKRNEFLHKDDQFAHTRGLVTARVGLNQNDR